jgi:hypothetical protein
MTEIRSSLTIIPYQQGVPSSKGHSQRGFQDNPAESLSSSQVGIVKAGTEQTRQQAQQIFRERSLTSSQHQAISQYQTIATQAQKEQITQLMGVDLFV